MNIRGYWSVIGKWGMLLKFNDVGGLNFGTLSPTRVTITRIRDKFEVRWNGKRYVERLVQKKEEVPLITRVLMHSCRFLHGSQRSHWDNVLMRLVSRNPVFIEFCELKNGSLTFRTCPRSTSFIIGGVLWQKVDILNMYRLKFKE